MMGFHIDFLFMYPNMMRGLGYLIA